MGIARSVARPVVGGLVIAHAWAHTALPLRGLIVPETLAENLMPLFCYGIALFGFSAAGVGILGVWPFRSATRQLLVIASAYSLVSLVILGHGDLWFGAAIDVVLLLAGVSGFITRLPAPAEAMGLVRRSLGTATALTAAATRRARCAACCARCAAAGRGAHLEHRGRRRPDVGARRWRAGVRRGVPAADQHDQPAHPAALHHPAARRRRHADHAAAREAPRVPRAREAAAPARRQLSLDRNHGNRRGASTVKPRSPAYAPPRAMRVAGRRRRKKLGDHRAPRQLACSTHS